MSVYDILNCYWRPSLKARYATLANVGPSVVHCQSRCNISKTKQDRPIVAIEHYIEIGTANSIAVF